MPTLSRELGLLPLVATGVCAMVGAGITVVPFALQRQVPGIGPWVLAAYACAAVPALLAALAYAILGSAMPEAGGSYVYARRGLQPYVGFIASWAQWFSLCVATGVVAYLVPPFARDAAAAAGWPAAAAALETGAARVGIPLAVLWGAALVNLRGVRAYARVVVPLMALALALGGAVIAGGWTRDASTYAAALAAAGTPLAPPPAAGAVDLRTVITAAALLFSSFIGFESIAQAGGEARDPARTIPRAIVITVVGVAAFYLLFTGAVYHAVPWWHVAAEARVRDVSAPGLLAPVLPPAWTIAVASGAAVALVKDLPAMLLGVSRLVFAWAEDGIVPARAAAVDPVHRVPRAAIVASALVGTLSVIGCRLAGDFFLGIDILVTSMLANYLVMCLTVLALPHRAPDVARAVSVLPGRGAQLAVGTAGALSLAGFLALHTWRDLAAPAASWWMRTTPVWLLVMGLGTLVYALGARRRAARGGSAAAPRLGDVPGRA